MRHRKHRHQLGRKKEHREALMANLTAALIRHGRIQTTLSKAKALRPYAERVITLAKKANGLPADKALHYRRLAQSRVRDTEAATLLFKERVVEFQDRPGGYTRIYKLGTRVGDGAEMAVIQLIPASDEGYTKPKRRAAKKAVKKVAKPAEEQAPATEEATEPAEAVAEATAKE